MKNIIIPLALLLSLPAMARNNGINTNDTLGREAKEIHLSKVLSAPVHRHIYQRSQNPRFRGHWSGFNLGFVNLTTSHDPLNGTPDDYLEMECENSLVMQFNIFQHSIRLNKLNNLGLVTGVGLEYQRFRFAHKNSITRGDDGQIYPLEIREQVYPQEIKGVKKSSWKNLYLTIPLICEWQFPAKNYRRVYVGAGITGGWRLHTKTKVVYRNENGDKRRYKKAGNYSMNPIKADIVARAGYHKLAIWGSYTLNRMVKSGKAPDLHPYAIGFGVNF